MTVQAGVRQNWSEAWEGSHEAQRKQGETARVWRRFKECICQHNYGLAEELCIPPPQKKTKKNCSLISTWKMNPNTKSFHR